MVAAAMIEKFLTVVRRHRRDTVLPQTQPSQRAHKAGYLRIDPANTGVVESNNILAMPPQPRRCQIPTVPVRVQVSRPRGIERGLSHQFERFLPGIVRRVRVHKMQP